MEKIMFKVHVDAITREFEMFSKYFNETEEENMKYSSIANAIVCNNKINEEDDPVPVKKGTRRPGNRRDRRKATRKAKRNRQSMATYAMDEIMPNSGKVKNTGYAVYEKGAKLYKRNKLTAREIALAVNDGDGFYYEPEDTDECYWEENPDGSIKQETLRFWFEDDEPAEELEEDYYRYWDDDLKDHVYVHVETETAKLRREINTYKDFLGEFNLNTLYQRWLADNS